MPRDPGSEESNWSRSHSHERDYLCSVQFCGRVGYAKGLCSPHYQRLNKRNAVRANDPVRRGLLRSEGVVKYGPAHERVRKAYGSASTYDCVDCDGQAQHWCYDGEDPEQQWDAERGVWYSLNTEYYAPRCVRCHSIFDHANPPQVRAS